jgi:hypothetical protein
MTEQQTQVLELDDNMLRAYMLLQEAEKDIAAAQQLSEDDGLDSVVFRLSCQAITRCRQAYYLYTGEKLSIAAAPDKKNALSALSYAQQVFAKAFIDIFADTGTMQDKQERKEAETHSSSPYDRRSRCAKHNG